MRNIGDLENFKLGMGLRATEGQTVRSKHVEFSGLAENGSNSYLFLGLAVLILFIFLK